MSAGRNDFVWKSTPVARRYLEGVRGGIPLAAEQIALLSRLVNAATKRVGTFLDLGCGDGILAAAIFGQHRFARGVLVDFSPPMLAAAQERLKQFQQRVVFLQLDYGKPGWFKVAAQHAPFDVIVSGFSIHHQPDARKRSLYEELFRLLGPSGIFLNLEHVSSPTRWAEKIYEQAFVDGLHAWGKDNGARKSKGALRREFDSREDKKANILASVEGQCDWLREIGFRDVDCYFKFLEIALFGGRR